MVKKNRNNLKRIVAKFGGSSLADGERILKAVKAVAKAVQNGNQVVVVVSAMGKTTDALLGIINQSSRGKISPNLLDDILSMGERTSARLFAAALKAHGVEARCFDPADADWPIITDNSFTNAWPKLDECLFRVRRHVLPLLERGITPVVAGFLGKTKDGQITTLGRGGSDTTAFIIGKAIQADEVVLVTDVDGILSGDPKIVHQPKRIEQITVESLAGLADSGTKFLHFKALKYKDDSFDVRVINHQLGKLNGEGTIIVGSLPSELNVSLAHNEPVIMITIVGERISENPEIIQDIASTTKRFATPLLGSSSNYNSIVLYLPQNSPRQLVEALHSIVLKHKETFAVAIRENLALLKVKGVGLEEQPGLIGRIAEPLRANHLNIFGIFTITSSVLVLVEWNNREKAIKLVRKSLKKKFHGEEV
jgi:aspartate kinase